VIAYTGEKRGGVSKAILARFNEMRSLRSYGHASKETQRMPDHAQYLLTILAVIMSRNSSKSIEPLPSLSMSPIIYSENAQIDMQIHERI